ncbi:hypothetical protein B0H13DRAFT_1901689 [Mycena leptocephala]|nr:hypothetical protein B0H13DRAFT_1901689 [Mycena leptocephala]
MASGVGLNGANTPLIPPLTPKPCSDDEKVARICWAVERRLVRFETVTHVRLGANIGKRQLLEDRELVGLELFAGCVNLRDRGRVIPRIHNNHLSQATTHTPCWVHSRRNVGNRRHLPCKASQSSMSDKARAVPHRLPQGFQNSQQMRSGLIRWYLHEFRAMIPLYNVNEYSFPRIRVTHGCTRGMPYQVEEKRRKVGVRYAVDLEQFPTRDDNIEFWGNRSIMRNRNDSTTLPRTLSAARLKNGEIDEWSVPSKYPPAAQTVAADPPTAILPWALVCWKIPQMHPGAYGHRGSNIMMSVNLALWTSSEFGALEAPTVVVPIRLHPNTKVIAARKFHCLVEKLGERLGRVRGRYLRVLPADNPTCFGSLGSLALARATERSVMVTAVMSFCGPQERLASNRQSETQLTVDQRWTKTFNTLKEQVSKPFCNINTKSQHASGFRAHRASPRFALETPHQVYTPSDAKSHAINITHLPSTYPSISKPTFRLMVAI